MELVANFELSNDSSLDALFEINASGTTWGSIDGNIENQTDLKGALDTLSSQIDGNHSEITTINNTLQTYGDIVTYDAANFATSAQGVLADTALQPNDNITELNNNAGYIDSSALNGYATENWVQGQIGNGALTIQRNGSAIGTFTANATQATTVNITVPTQASDIGALPDTTTIGNGATTILVNSTSVGTITANQTTSNTVSIHVPTTATEIGALPSDTTIEDLTTSAQQAALNSGATSVNISAIATNTSAISAINGKIPNDATTANQLTTEAFVNSSIATNTANFIGTFNSVAELEAYSGTLTNNDYAFVETTDSAGNTLYDRYKWNGTEWLFEYELNNSSFTAEQWAAINSGITTSGVSAIAANTSAIQGKQDALIAGTNIQLNGNTISATDTTYSAGANISIVNGTISATSTSYTLPAATTSSLGGIKVGNNLSISADGTLDSTGAIWGAITGDIDNQIDLQNTLNKKQGALIAGRDLQIVDSTTKTVSGSNYAVITDAKANSLTSVVLKGGCTQTGTPTPTSPADIVCNNGVLGFQNGQIYINGTTEKIEILGKNLFNKNASGNESGWYGYGSQIVGEPLRSKNASSNYNTSAPIRVYPNVTYTASNESGSSPSYLFLDKNMNYVDGFTNGNDTTKTFTVPNNNSIYYMRMPYPIANADICQLERGVNVTSYEPYTVIASATAANLLSVDTNYTDTQSVIDGTITRKVGIKVLDGTEDWYYDSSGNRFYVIILSKADSVLDLFSTHYQAARTTSTNNAINLSSSGTTLYIKDERFTTVATFQQFLREEYQNGTPVIILYPLASETTETVTGQTMANVEGYNDFGITQGSIDSLDFNISYTSRDVINYVGGSPVYSTSDTAEDTAEKVVSIPEITELKVGQMLIIQPSITSTVANSSIKLNNFPAYPMKYNGSAITTSTDSTVWNQNFPSLWVFDGSYWIFAGHGVDTNTTYSNMSVSEGTTGTATTSRVMRADYLKQIIQGTALTNLSTSTTAAVTATDTILDGVGKLQAQINGITVPTATSALTNDSGYITPEQLVAGTDIKITRLPDQYNELEYIQSDGACKIDLGIISNGNDTVIQKFQKVGTDTGNIQCWFGSIENTTPRFGIGVNAHSFFAGFNITGIMGAYDNNTHIIEIYKNGTDFMRSIDGVASSYSPANQNQPTINSYLFARHGSSSDVYDGNGTKIYYHRQWRTDGTPLLNLVPAERKADGILGFYNLVDNTFLVNTGTGTFTGGPEVHPLSTLDISFSNNSGYITSSDLSGYATETWVGNQGYLTTIPTATTSSLGVVQPDGTTVTINNGVISAAGSSLPSQTGNAGKVLTTDGTDASWGATSEVYPIIETYSNGTAWYKVYAPDSTGYKWCEQGGWLERTATGILSVALLKNYVNTNYSIQATNRAVDSYTSASTYYTPYVLSQTTSGFSLSSNASISNIGYFIWEAKGYIAS